MLLPYSVLLRPFLLVFASSRLRTAMVTLAYALAKSRVVFGVGGSLLLVAAVISTTFLGEDLAAADGGDLYGALQSTAVSMVSYPLLNDLRAVPHHHHSHPLPTRGRLCNTTTVCVRLCGRELL